MYNESSNLQNRKVVAIATKPRPKGNPDILEIFFMQLKVSDSSETSKHGEDGKNTDYYVLTKQSNRLKNQNDEAVSY